LFFKYEYYSSINKLLPRKTFRITNSIIFKYKYTLHVNVKSINHIITKHPNYNFNKQYFELFIIKIIKNLEKV